MKKILLFASLLFATFVLSSCGSKDLVMFIDALSDDIILESNVLLNKPLKKSKEIEAYEKKQVPGHSFDGWYYYDGTPFSFDDKFTTSDEIFGRWNLITYEINYHLNAGMVDFANPDVYNINDKVALNSARRTGYFFLGWYKEQQFKNKITELNGLYENLNLFARFEREYTFNVTFESNGGTSVDDQCLVNTNIVENPQDMSKPGHQFLGWFIDEECLQIFDYNEKITGDLTLHAKWLELEYKITYILDENLTTTNPSLIKYNENYTLIALDVDKNYTFGGWFTNMELIGDQIINLIKLDNDLVLYPKIIPKQYSLIFDYSSIPTVLIDYLSSYIIPSYPAIFGEQFKCWNNLKDLTGENFNPGDQIIILENTKLFPVFHNTYLEVTSQDELIHALNNHNGNDILVTKNFEISSTIDLPSGTSIRSKKVGISTGSIRTLTTVAGVNGFKIVGENVTITDLNFKQNGSEHSIVIKDSYNITLKSLGFSGTSGVSEIAVFITNSDVIMNQISCTTTSRNQKALVSLDQESKLDFDLINHRELVANAIIEIRDTTRNNSNLTWHQNFGSSSGFSVIIDKVVGESLYFFAGVEVTWDYNYKNITKTEKVRVIKGQTVEAPVLDSPDPYMVLEHWADRTIKHTSILTISSSRTFKASWIYERITVSMKAYPFSEDFNLEFIVDYLDRLPSFSNPTYKNFAIAGWYTDENLEVEFNLFDPILDHLILYAKWYDKDGNQQIDDSNATGLMMVAYQNLQNSNSYESSTTGLVKTTMGDQTIFATRIKSATTYLTTNKSDGISATSLVTYLYDNVYHYKKTSNPWVTTSELDYQKNFGVLPHDINYIVNNKTVLKESEISFDGKHYFFTLELDPIKATYNYIVQINANSPLTVSKDTTFNYISLAVVLDHNKNFVSITATEEYIVYVFGEQLSNATITETFSNFNADLVIEKPEGVI